MEKNNISKKAQSMSMNVIIVAVIALIVLVVLLFIFNDKINIFGKGISDCKGICSNKLTDVSSSCDNIVTGGAKYTYNPAGICKIQTQVCCIKVYQEPTQ